jgi:heptaprenyl diphosphate synthase
VLVPPPSPLLNLLARGDELDRVEAALRASVETEDADLSEIASHLIRAGGKRLRPVCTLVAARTAGGPVTDDVVMGGVAVELVHLGSLYHDDVIDEAETRRGIESVNARWGNLTAILAGDILLGRASEIAASLGTEVAGLLARTIVRLCQGEVAQLRDTFDVHRDEPNYLRSIEGKTASLFSTACRIGGLVTGTDRPQVDALSECGRAFGMAFQIYDDVLDLTASEAELGKPAGHDLIEGVYTLPVIRTLAAGGSAAAELEDLLVRPLDGAELDKALAIVRSGQAVPSAVATAREYAERARVVAATLPPSDAAAALGDAAHALLDSLASEAA